LRRLPEKSVGTVQTCRDSSFQTRGEGGAAATGKARSPTVGNAVRQTIIDDDDAERRRPSDTSKVNN